MILITVFVGLVALLPRVDTQIEGMDMMGLINILYLKVDTDLDGLITPVEMASLWDTMDLNGDGQVNITEFIRVWEQVTNYGPEIASAYFFLADLDGNGELNALDDSSIYARFDVNGDGLIQSQEFVTKYSQIYHEVPFVVLFLRVNVTNNNNLHLTQQEFSQLFQSLTLAADGSVDKAEFEKQWTLNNFGSLKDADDVFAKFDSDKNGIMSTSEVDAKFTSLDVNGNGTLEILEVIELADTTAR